MTNTRTLLCAATLLAVTAAVTIAATQTSDTGDFSKPTVHHDILDKLWGKWDYMVTVESDDGATESLVLEADYRWALGGRFLVGGFDGYIDGGLFQAREILGYDSFRGEYRSVWVDNNTTAFTLATGEYIARTRTLTFKGVQDNVEKDVRDEPFTFVYRFVDEDHFQIEVWRPNPAGKMIKGTTVSATRKGTEDN
jgi:hypothetical protein